MSARESMAERLERLERRVRVLEDVEAIRRLKARYGSLADARYAGGQPREPAELARLAGEIAGLFTEDAEWDGGPALGVCRGRDAIRARFARPTLRFAWHVFAKPHIVVDGDRARGSWDVLAPCTTSRGEPCWMAGVEEDVYRRVDGVWLHERMKLHPVFFAPHRRGWSLGVDRAEGTDGAPTGAHERSR